MSKDAVYLINKGGHWYKPNCQGYTSSAILAGRYSAEEAEEYTHPNGPDGPRDGLHFVHVDDVKDDAFAMYRALASRVAELEAAQGQMVASVNHDEIAKMIYDVMLWAALEPVPDGCVPEWVDGGNSDAQMRARDAERRIISTITLTPHAEAKRKGMLEAADIVDAADVLADQEQGHRIALLDLQEFFSDAIRAKAGEEK